MARISFLGAQRQSAAFQQRIPGRICQLRIDSQFAVPRHRHSLLGTQEAVGTTRVRPDYQAEMRRVKQSKEQASSYLDGKPAHGMSPSHLFKTRNVVKFE